MEVHRKDKQITVQMEGAIGETTGLFTLPLAGTLELVLDMAKVTFINSIGVKHWIMWTLRIPKHCAVKIYNCPFVIVSQASMVLGFITPLMKIESLRAPYACDACGHEELRLLELGKHYEYPKAGLKSNVTLAAPSACTKCGKGHLEPDFLPEKTFKFLG